MIAEAAQVCLIAVSGVDGGGRQTHTNTNTQKDKHTKDKQNTRTKVHQQNCTVTNIIYTYYI